MYRENPLNTLNTMVIFQTKGLPYRNKVRLAVLSHLSGNEINSSLEIPPSTVSKLLYTYFPTWQDITSYPSEDDQRIIRGIAEQCAARLVEELGDPEEYHARLEAEAIVRRAIKEAAKQEQIRIYEERQALKKQRKDAKKAKAHSIAAPNVRRIFEP